jgi:hypothetical protein
VGQRPVEAGNQDYPVAASRCRDKDFVFLSFVNLYNCTLFCCNLDVLIE